LQTWHPLFFLPKKANQADQEVLLMVTGDNIVASGTTVKHMVPNGLGASSVSFDDICLSPSKRDMCRSSIC
jgi:hypothetical protein